MLWLEGNFVGLYFCVALPSWIHCNLSHCWLLMLYQYITVALTIMQGCSRDSQHSYSCSYPVILCSRSKINFQLRVRIQDMYKHPQNGIFIVATRLPCSYHGRMGGPSNTQQWWIVEPCEEVCCMHGKNAWIYSKPCAKKHFCKSLSAWRDHSHKPYGNF